MAGAGLTLGAGVVLTPRVGDCPLELTSQITAYLVGESARKCGPCFNGLPALAAAVRAVTDGSGGVAEVERLTGLVSGRGACSHPDGTVRMVALDAFGFPRGSLRPRLRSLFQRPSRAPLKGANVKRVRSRALLVDWQACKGRGLCHEVLPELVQLDDWGYPVITGPVSDDLVSSAREAVRVCPQLALRLERQ